MANLMKRDIEIQLCQNNKSIPMIIYIIAYQHKQDLQGIWQIYKQKLLDLNEIIPDNCEISDHFIKIDQKLGKKNFVVPNQTHFEESGMKISIELKGNTVVVNIQSVKNEHYLKISGWYESDAVEYIPENNCQLSKKQEHGIFSFINNTNLKKQGVVYEVPIYLKYDQLKYKSYQSIEKDNEITKDGELKCINNQILKKQSGVLYDLIKQVTQSIMEGRGVVGVSLPVRIFQPVSTIERIIDWWSFCPNYLPKACKMKDGLQRLIQTIGFGFSGLHVSTSQQKPFNPILGETYQGVFEQDGTEIFCEHTSHHPPITNYYLVNKKEGFKYYGSYEYIVNHSKTFNSLYFQQKGLNQLEFKDGGKIEWELPQATLNGMMTGDRILRYQGVLSFVDRKNQLKAVIKIGGNAEKEGGFMGFGGTQRTDIIKGKIYQYDPNYTHPELPILDEKYKHQWKMQDLVKEVCQIEGSWIKNLVINGQEIWNIDKMQPNVHTPIQNPLPSDPRFREDLIWLRYNNIEQADRWKVLLEMVQRHDRKNRVKK